ncbi:hypothetical protein M3Y97_00786700 [Aphelenchoides bicaudatus]|nr:hypothetical protein M3Y97_00786700 [Aphelenchoides bicaudatus]
MRFAVVDIVGSPVSEEETDYHFDYTDPNGNLDETGRIKAFYGLIFVLTGFVVFIRLYISIFGRRMRNEGFRWHSIYLSIFNIAQLAFYADTATSSPWYDYLRNVYITKHALAIEQATLTAFPASLTCLVPAYLLTYAVPALRRSFVFKWFFWLVAYIILTIVPVYLLLDYMNSLNGTGNLPFDPLISYYQFAICYLATTWAFLLLIVIMFGYACLCGYAVSNHNLSDRSVLRRKTKNNNSLFMFAAYCWTVAFFCVPKNLINMMNFYMVHIVPLIKEAAPAYASSNENPQQMMEKMISYAAIFNKLLLYIPLAELLFPVVEFVAACTFLKIYRESLLNLLSCGVLYHGDSHGSIWRLLPNSYRAVQPIEANPFRIVEEPASLNTKTPPVKTVSKDSDRNIKTAG